MFVIDLIIVLVGDRMTQVDLEILRSCRRFRTPTFIVRSKADIHTRNIVRSHRSERGDKGAETFYQRCHENSITGMPESIADLLRQVSLPPQKVYIVSCSRRLMLGFQYRGNWLLFSKLEYIAVRRVFRSHIPHK